MNEEEEAFIRRFVAKDKQERYIGFMSKPKLRGKFLKELYHRLPINGSLAVEVHNRDQAPERVEQWLRAKGAGLDAYVISPSSELDQRWMLLRQVLDAIYEQDMEAIICCKTGELAYYKSEDSAWILHFAGRQSDRNGRT